MFYSFIATGYFLFCNTQNANKYYTCKYENKKIGSQKCSSLFACLSYTEYDSSIFSTFFVVFREFWTSLTRMSLRSSTRQEHTYSTLVEKIYTTNERKSAWVFKECHSLCSVFSSFDIMSYKQLRNNSSRLVIYLFT